MDVFDDVSKFVLLKAGAILLRRFHTMRCILAAGAALWTCPDSLAGAALQTCRVACFSRIALAGLRDVVTKCKFLGMRGNSICET